MSDSIPFREKIKTISISASGLPTRRSEVNRIAKTEEQWDRDFAAYRRLRREGLQPKHADGSAALEARANEAHEIEGRPDPKAFERLVE